MSRKTLSRVPTLHTAESIAQIMLKPHQERTMADYEDIHYFMTSKVKFF